MPDGTMSFMDFMGSRLNRYQNPDAASKNRVHPPSKTLYYWNAPVDWTEESIKKVTRCTLSLTNAMYTRCNNTLMHLISMQRYLINYKFTSIQRGATRRD